MNTNETFKNNLRDMVGEIGFAGVLDFLAELPKEAIQALSLVGYSSAVNNSYKSKLNEIERELKDTAADLRIIEERYISNQRVRSDVMLWTQMNSESIQEVGYNAGAKELRIHFLSGGEYSYLEVPEWIYDEFISTSRNGWSVNAVFREYVEGRFDGAKLTKDGRRMTKEEQLASRKRGKRK